MSSNRLSRAAIFAGAIAAPACWTGTTPTTGTPEQPMTKPITRTGTITGIVTDLRTKYPALRQGVSLRAPDGSIQSALTDEKGRYTFPELPPGTYTLLWSNQPGPEPAKRSIIVEAGAVIEANIAILRPDIPIAAPYGAPPARLRRV